MRFNIWKVGTFLLAFVLLVIGITVGVRALTGFNLFSFISSDNPADVVTDFNRALCEADLDGAQEKLSATVGLPPELMRLGLGAGARECKDNGGLDEVVIREAKIDGEVAAVHGFNRFKNGKTSFPFAMKLYLEKGEWKIAFNPNALK